MTTSTVMKNTVRSPCANGVSPLALLDSAPFIGGDMGYRIAVVPGLLALLMTLQVGPAWGHPPELPRLFLDTTLVPPTGKTIAVTNGADVQAAIDNAQAGDVIMLQAGATFTGPFTLPKKRGHGSIIVRTSAHDSTLPPPGTRVTPSHAAAMPKIVAGASSGHAIVAASGAHHFRFIGIEIMAAKGSTTFDLVQLGSGSDRSTRTLPHDIIIDRCYIHGLAGEAAIRGVALNGKRLAVIDSYLAEFKHNVGNTQPIGGGTGPGPFKIVNNYRGGAGENVFWGAPAPPPPPPVPWEIPFSPA